MNRNKGLEGSSSFGLHPSSSRASRRWLQFKSPLGDSDELTEDDERVEFVGNSPSSAGPGPHGVPLRAEQAGQSSLL